MKMTQISNQAKSWTCILAFLGGNNHIFLQSVKLEIKHRWEVGEFGSALQWRLSLLRRSSQMSVLLEVQIIKYPSDCRLPIAWWMKLQFSYYTINNHAVRTWRSLKWECTNNCEETEKYNMRPQLADTLTALILMFVGLKLMITLIVSALHRKSLSRAINKKIEIKI